MTTSVSRRAWLLIHAGDDRGHGGNLGYDDTLGIHHAWDSEVKNYTHRASGSCPPTAATTATRSSTLR